eukprot:319660-Prymnesium_polylepis.3
MASHSCQVTTADGPEEEPLNIVAADGRDATEGISRPARALCLCWRSPLGRFAGPDGLSRSSSRGRTFGCRRRC